MVHLLYQELSNIYRTALLSFLTSDYVGSKQGSELLSLDYKLSGKQLNDKQIHIGEK
jgi:hypothetical protein